MKTLKLYDSVHFLNHLAARIDSEKLPYFCLTVILNGSLVYTVDGKSYTLNVGDALLAPAGCTLSRERSASKTNYLCFDFFSEQPINLPIKMEGCIDGALTLLIEAYDALVKNARINKKEIAEHLLNLFILQLEETMRSKSYSGLTQKIIDYIERNLSNKITLSDISKFTFFSPGYCENVFKRDTGKSINDYLINERLENAKKLLAEDVLTLEAISESIGIEDYNYFSRLFKKRTGFTPKEYRKKLCNYDVYVKEIST